jgi:hypothetical protein
MGVVGIFGVRDIVVHLDAHSVLDMGAAILGELVAIDYANVGIVQVFCQPVCVCQQFWTGVALSGHICASENDDSSVGGSIAQV